MFMMDGSQGSSGGPAPFLAKTYEMVDDLGTNDIVSWSQNGNSFVVWNPPDFARDLLPKYFKHNNFSSFIRQLNTYGFRKIDADQWEFANESFIKGQRHLLKNIFRRKPIHSHSGQGNAAVQMSNQERVEFEKEIESLKSDNGSLQSELESHKQENQSYEFGMNSLRQRLLRIDQKQRQLKTSLAQLLQKPELTSTVAQQSESQSKKRRLLVSNYLYEEASKRDRPMVTLCDDDPNTSSVPMISLELIDKLDTCVGFWENFLQDVVSNLPIEEDAFDFALLHRQSPLIVSEVHTASGDSDLNIQPNSPPWSHPSPSPSKDIYSTPESSNHSGSPVILSIYTNLESKARVSGIDVNSSPDIADTDEQKHTQAGREQPPPVGANDVFWQQFLTETPGSSDTPEVQSERREDDCSRLVNPNGSWLNMDSLAKQMGHLTPAEKT